MRLLLIEDNRAMAAYIVDGMKRAGYALDHVETGEDGLSCLRGIDYDLILCDVMLPGLSGFDLVKELRKTNPRVPVLFLSARNTVEDRVEGLSLGGDDYLVKPFAFSELLARAEALLRRSSLAGEQIKEMRVADLRLDPARRKAYRGAQEIVLQPLEFQLLEYMVRNEGRVLSKTLILEQIWDFNFNPESNVVEVRVHHLRSKVDKGFPTRLIHTVRGVGYVLEAR